MLLQDTVEGIIEAEGNGRISLKLHAHLVAVEIYSGYDRIFE